MCKIRIITKLGANTIKENMVDIDTFLGVVERPAYIEKNMDDDNNMVIIFHYSGSIEKYKSIQYNEIFLEYGDVSGRIKKLKTNKRKLFETDIYNLQKLATGNISKGDKQQVWFMFNLQKKEASEVQPSPRFSSNFKEGLILANKILSME